VITHVALEDFKCFAALRLSYGALTLLTGYNAGGKSSALQPLLLLAQQLRRAPSLTEVGLNGPLVRLGTVGDIVPAGVASSNPSFTFESPSDTLHLRFGARAGERTLHVRELMPSEAGRDPNGEVLRTLRTLVFISAVRAPTGAAYPVPDAEQDWRSNVGLDGRYAAYWLDRTSDDVVPEARRHPNEPADSVRKQVDAWMGTLFPGAQVNARLLPEASSIALQFRLRAAGEWQRPANVGYGLTYALPIIVALLVAREGQVVVIDSPEAHLHPSAQSQMGRALAHFAASGVQIVVETHSDHLLNGSRLAVREGRLAPSAVRVHFFAGSEREGNGVTTLRMDEGGRIDDWPRGFFDQAEQDLASLTGWE
jgi:predicted ATPase